MKKMYLFLFVLLMSLSASAQLGYGMYASGVSHIPLHQGDKVLTRNYMGSSVLVHYIETANACRHHFALINQDNAQARELVLQIGSERGDSFERYGVNDMRILGDTCYFCGVCVSGSNEPVYDVNGSIIGTDGDNQGFLGFFRVSEISGDEAPTVSIKVFPDVKRLTRMAVRRGEAGSEPGHQVRVTAIASVLAQGSDVELQNSLIEVDLFSGNTSVFTVSRLVNSQERFSDIVNTRYATIVSSFLDQDGTKLMLHQAGSQGFDQEYAATGFQESVRTYDFASRPGQWGLYAAGAISRMSNLPSDRFALAFGCRNDDGVGGIMTMTFTNGGMADTVIVVSDTLESAEVLEVEYSSIRNSLGILARKAANPFGAVYLPSLSTVGSVPELEVPRLKLQSLCKYRNQVIMGSGINMITLELTSMWQHPLALERPGCVESHSVNSFVQDNFVAEKGAAEWTRKVLPTPFSWDRKLAYVTVADHSFECTQPIWFMPIPVPNFPGY